jgi:carbon-monoxide dehydrogenase large subunit
VIGRSVKRLEDAALLTGQGRFVDDIFLPGMLQAAFQRSPHAHARIGDISTRAAVSLPGVHAVLTLADLRPHLANHRLVVGLPSASYKQSMDRPALADGEAVHVGEPLAIVVAEDRYVAEDAIALLEVDYEPLPCVSDCRDSLRAGAAPVHSGSASNLLAAFEIAYGDVDAAFAAAPHAFRETLWQHRGASHSIECRGVVASFSAAEDRLTLWSSTQMPHAARQVLADMLGWDEERVRVITPDVGGGFGPKLVFYPEDVAVAVAAIRLGRPVKWIEDRREHFSATTQERDQYWDIEIATDDAGKILGVRGEMLHDHGAYTARGVNLPYESAQTVTLPYIVPSYRLSVKLALTNKVPVTPVRGAGQPQGVFAMERLLDRVAGELGLDRAELRRRNLVPASAMPYRTELRTRGGIAVVLDSGDYPGCQALAMQRADWAGFPARRGHARAAGRYLGIGLANFVKGTGRGPFEPVTVRVAASGRVHVFTGAAAMGQGTKTMLAQIVAAHLGADPERIIVTAGDTSGTTLGMGGFNSRQAVLAGNSADIAAHAVRHKTLQVAGRLLEAAAEDLEIIGDRVQITGAPGSGLSLGDISRRMHGTAGFVLPGAGAISPGLEATEAKIIDAMTYANGTAVVELEVDPETGSVKIHRFTFAHDCGTVINPMLVDGQIIGGAAHGIGNALFEWMGFDDQAQPVTTNLGEYLLLTAPEMPPIDIFHLCSPSPLNPLGVKGVGECGVLPAAPAIMSAIENALHPLPVHLTQTPISPAELVALIEAARRLGHNRPDDTRSRHGVR